MDFKKLKQASLSKKDKSSKKILDVKISRLCKKINSLNDYYTTSSCSGRIVLIIDKNKKAEGLFLKVWHDLINFSKLKKELKKILSSNSLNVKFKQEPCILHVACYDLNSALKLLDKARKNGWKRSGITSSGKKFVVELISTEKLEFPIVNKGKLLIDNNFLKIIAEKSNINLKKSWEKIEKLRKSL